MSRLWNLKFVKNQKWSSHLFLFHTELRHSSKLLSVVEHSIGPIFSPIILVLLYEIKIKFNMRKSSSVLYFDSSYFLLSNRFALVLYLSYRKVQYISFFNSSNFLNCATLLLITSNRQIFSRRLILVSLNPMDI